MDFLLSYFIFIEMRHTNYIQYFTQLYLLTCIYFFHTTLAKKIITPSHIHRHTQINIFKHCFESLYNYTTLAVLAQIQHAALIKLFINFFLTYFSIYIGYACCFFTFLGGYYYRGTGIGVGEDKGERDVLKGTS